MRQFLKRPDLFQLSGVLSCLGSVVHDVLRGDNTKVDVTGSICQYGGSKNMLREDVSKFRNLTLGEIIDLLDSVREPYDPKLSQLKHLSPERQEIEARRCAAVRERAERLAIKMGE